MSFQNTCSFCSGSLLLCVCIVLTSTCGCSLVRAFGKYCNAHNNNKGSVSLYRKCALLFVLKTCVSAPQKSISLKSHLSTGLRKTRLQNIGCSRVCSWWKDDWKPRRVRGEGGGEAALWILAVVLNLLLLLYCIGSQFCPWRKWMFFWFLWVWFFFPWDSMAKKKKGSRTGVEVGVLSKYNLSVGWAFMRKQVNMESDNLEEAVGNHFHHRWHNGDF